MSKAMQTSAHDFELLSVQHPRYSRGHSRSKVFCCKSQRADPFAKQTKSISGRFQRDVHAHVSAVRPFENEMCNKRSERDICPVFG